jgi:holo-[acyl-carrier protein] synthase
VAVLGTGIDIVEIARLEEVIARRGHRFADRVFTESERAYCDGRPRPAIHYAGRFAVKEAVLKAIRTGWVKGIRWTDIEVTLGASGAPSVRLTGGALARARKIGVTSFHISISHTDTNAVACAIAEGEKANP